MSDGEWNSQIWPGPFQKMARVAVTAKPAPGRFLHLESARVDAGYALPWNGLQFVDATIVFNDHAENSPAEGELSYTWHVRLPTTTGGGMFAIADGYEATGPYPRTDTYWTASALEQEATSAVAGYLWGESFTSPAGTSSSRTCAIRRPFWHARFEALKQLNTLYVAGTLTARRFENVTARIDRFDPLTYFGGGVVTATIGGRLVETVSGKTHTEPFTQAMRFFRFGSSGAGISGWTAVDAQQDGVGQRRQPRSRQARNLTWLMSLEDGGRRQRATGEDVPSVKRGFPSGSENTVSPSK